jgi:tetratricopeptide (TPR) repeat protein
MPRLQSLVLLVLGASAAWLTPEQSQAQRELTVVVVNAHADPSQPIQGARVSLSFVAGSEKVVDARDATNRAGQALLLVSQEAAQRGDLRVEITGAGDLVVLQPADGQLNGLPATVSVRLLPKGSPALLGPAQIEAMLHRLSLQNQHLEQENREVKGALAAAKSQKPDDLTVAMTVWAKANGFAIADADKQVQEWAEEIQKRKEQATADEKALAELALKHYGVAAALFNQSATDIGESMDEDEKKFLEDRRKKLSDLVHKSYQSSNAYRLNLQYHQATQVLEQARDRAAAEHGRYPEDAALRSIWLEVLGRAADARVNEGAFGKAGGSLALMAQSVKDYEDLLREWSGPADRRYRAMAQTNLGNALLEQGERSGGAQAAALFAQAVEAYRAALEVHSKAETPKDWATTQNSFGVALMNQGERSRGAQATNLLAQAVEAYRAALEVYTKADLPQNWAGTENNLGVALWNQGERSGGAQATNLLAQAVEAYRAALEVYTKADTPQDWAMTETDLGVALSDQGERSGEAQAAELFAQAVKAYRAALEVRTKAELPQDWALTQNNLGSALLEEGERSSGAQAMELFAQAVEAYRAALEVRTKADLPQYWATTQTNLGVALSEQGERSSGAQAADLFAQAVEAYRAALEVRTKADLPESWAASQNNLGNALTDQGERSSGTAATALFAQAVEAYRAALEVRTKADLPQDWAITQNNLGKALLDEGDFVGASDAFEASLEIFPMDEGALASAAAVDHDKLYRFQRALELEERKFKVEQSTGNRLDLAEANLTAAHFDACLAQAASLDEAQLTAPVLLTRDVLKLSCQWGAGQKSAALETAEALLPRSAQLQKGGWEFAGTLHFLAASAAFETGRTSWIGLFENLEKGDGAAMANALRQLEQAMKQ